MIALLSQRMPRGALFLAFNAFAAVFLILFVFVPILTHFISRNEQISETAAQLSRFQVLSSNAKNLMKIPQTGDPFLPGSEERVVSADLQASLKTITTAAGVRLLGIRGLPSGRSAQLHMVAVSVELEGSLASIRNVLLTIENQVPFLFVAKALLRSLSDGDDGLIRAELVVQGAMRDSNLPTAAEVSP